MSATDIVAIYAAAISTVMAVLRLADWRRERRQREKPPIEVEPRFAMLGNTDGSVERVVAVRVHNRVDHPLRIASLGVMLQDGSGSAAHFMKPPAATLPGTIPAHDSGESWAKEESLVSDHGFDIYAPVEGWATLSTGETYMSEPKPLQTNRTPHDP